MKHVLLTGATENSLEWSYNFIQSYKVKTFFKLSTLTTINKSIVYLHQSLSIMHSLTYTYTPSLTSVSCLHLSIPATSHKRTCHSVKGRDKRKTYERMSKVERNKIITVFWLLKSRRPYLLQSKYIRHYIYLYNVQILTIINQIYLYNVRL